MAMTDSLGTEEYWGPEPLSGIWNFAGIQRDPGVKDLSSTSPQVQALINSGAINRMDRTWQNETGEGRYIYDSVNWGDPSLPKMGPGTTNINWTPIGSPEEAQNGLINPSMVYHDPNYGWLTPSSNHKVNQKNWYDLIGPLAMSAITLGAGAIAAGAAGAGTLAGGLGAGAAGEVMGGSAIAGGLTSTPWYIPAGMSVAKQVGGGDPSLLGVGTSLLPGLSEFGIPSSLLAGAGAASGLASSLGSRNYSPPQSAYNPALFGDMGSVAAVNDGSSQRVATALAPNAYSNSYNQVTT